jgi:cysteine-rich repeat protein
MHPYSACSPLCGDGIQQRGEQCDFAIHGPCYGDCTLSVEFCGNGFVDAGESCDDGVNDGHSLAGCPPGCQVGYCGDGIVQVGEACDLGKESNNGAYRACTSYCQLAARCGDGIVQVCGYEECDDGNQLSNDGCSAFCNFERLPL